jgi:septum formation protein
MSMIDPRIYLASRSPRRRELLAQVGVRFDVLLFRAPPREDIEVDEAGHSHESAEDYVQRVACAKATFAAQLIMRRHLPPRPVLAADTTLDVDGEVVGKPQDAAEAIAILTRLSGRSHRVLTAIAMAVGDRLEQRLSVSEVRFRTLLPEEIHHYVRTGEPMDKAGAYGIQGRAAMFIEEIHGSHSGIVGLPLCETALLLRDFGYPV